MKGNERSEKQRHSAILHILLAVCAAAGVLSLAIFVPQVRELIISLGEKYVGRPLTHEVWHKRFISWEMSFLVFDIVLAFIAWVRFDESKILVRECRRLGSAFSNKGQTICHGSFVLFLILTLISTLTHEPWIDEIYAWEISKFSISGIFYEMRYEGHFALWSLLLAPFSHLGFPLKTLGIISWSLNAVGVAYFVRKAPFSWWAKIALMLTFPFLYVNPVISRCYVLIPIFIFIFADVFQKTQKKECWEKNDDGYVLTGMLLALLANTHLYTEGFVGCVGLILLVQTICDWKTLSQKQRRNRALAFLIGIGGVLIAFLQILPSLQYSSVFVSGEEHSASPLVFLNGSGLLHPFPVRATIAAITVIATGIYLLKNNITALLIAIISILYMVALCVLVYSARTMNRALMWFYFIVFCLWISAQQKSHSDENKNNATPSILIAVLSLSLINPVLMIKDFSNLYSGESRFAYFIRDFIDADTPIYSNPNRWCCVIKSYLPGYNFYNMKDRTELAFDADRALPEAEKSSEYINNIFEEIDADFVYLMDSRQKSKSDPENIIERFDLPFVYEQIYPQTEEQKEYFLQYYLLKVHRPTRSNDSGDIPYAP